MGKIVGGRQEKKIRWILSDEWVWMQRIRKEVQERTLFASIQQLLAFVFEI
jgi:hypothetical protein